MTRLKFNAFWRVVSSKLSTLVSDVDGGATAPADVDTETGSDAEGTVFSTGVVLDDEPEGIQVEPGAEGAAADDDQGTAPDTSAGDKAAADKADKGDKAKPDAPVTKKDLAALNSKIEELKFTNEYWRGRAESGAEPDETETESPAADASDAEVDTFIKDLNEKGPDAIRKVMRREGFLSAADVKKMIRSEGGQLLKNQELLHIHPGLSDNTSTIFKETARQLKTLHHTGMSEGEMTAHAVNLAELALRQRGEWDGNKEEVDAEEKERQERVARQSGPGRRRGAIVSQDKTKLTKNEAFIAQEMGVDLKTALKHKQEHIVDER